MWDTIKKIKRPGHNVDSLGAGRHILSQNRVCARELLYILPERSIQYFVILMIYSNQYYF